MTPLEFRDRLEAVARRTGLTASDLAVWFDRPRPTIRTWLAGQNRPSPQIGGQVWDTLQQRLIWLERCHAFPIPGPPTRVGSRRDWLLRARDDERLRSIRQDGHAARPPFPELADL